MHINDHVHVYVCVYVCMYVCMYVCIQQRTSSRKLVNSVTCMYTSKYAYVIADTVTVTGGLILVRIFHYGYSNGYRWAYFLYQKYVLQSVTVLLTFLKPI